MKNSSIFDHNGMPKLAPKFNDDIPLKRTTKEEQRIIDICLNCTKKKCNGNCEEFRRSKKNAEKI